jgi:hypothetical protein
VIRVRPSVIAGNAIPENFLDLDQDFAMVVTNGLEAAVPVLAVPTSNEVALGVSVLHQNGQTDSSIIPGETAKITVAVSNLSQTAAASIQNAALSITVGTRTNTSPAVAFSPVPAGGSATNSVPFDLAIPSELRCGAVASLELALTTSDGPVRLNVPIRGGRPSGAPVQLLFDDVDSEAVKWKAKKGFGIVSTQAHSGTRSYHVEDPGKTFADTRNATLQLKKAITIPNNAGNVRLVFFHIFNFEPGYDGGVLEISGDNGETWEDAGSRILAGGYDGKVTSTSNNPLGSRFAWTSRGRPGVFSQVVINLDDFAGRKVKLRFRAGFDEAAGILNGFTGWFIDDIQVTATPHTCP